METIPSKNAVLDRATIGRKIKRMALEVAEQNIEENELVIAGIEGNGMVVAKAIIRELGNVSSLSSTLVTIRLNKKDPLTVSLDPAIDIEGKAVLVVDDVADSGRTLLYALKPFLAAHPKKIQTLVLVERSHKLFPVQTDYTGLSIATTLQEHITVETEGEEIRGAYLY